MNYLKNKWDEFRSLCINAEAPDFQVEAMRDSFYAGSLSLFEVIMTRLTPESEVTDTDISVMQSVQDELDAYADELNQRKKELSHLQH